jgi:hypothetical protein
VRAERRPQDSAKCDSEQARAKQDETNHGHSEENEFLAHRTLIALCSQRGALKARNRAGTGPLYGGFFASVKRIGPSAGQNWGRSLEVPGRYVRHDSDVGLQSAEFAPGTEINALPGTAGSA